MFIKPTIKKKILFLIVVIIFLLSVGHMLDAVYVKNTFFEHQKSLAKQDVHLAHERIEFSIINYKRDVSLLSKVLLAKNLIKNEIKKDLDEEAMIDLYAERRYGLENFLLEFVDSKLIYREISYFDNSGKELVRVEKKSAKSKSFVVRSKLENAKNKDYFIKVKNMQLGNVYISDFDLYRDGNSVTKPYQPVLVLSAPVLNEYNMSIGVVAATILLKELFDSIIKFDQDLYLVDKDFYYLINNKEQYKRWSKQLGNNYISDELKSHQIDNEPGGDVDLEHHIGDLVFADHLDKNHFLFFHKIYYNGFEDKDRYWMIGEIDDIDIFLSEYETLQDQILAINLVIFGLLFLFLFTVVSIYFIKPINSLIESMKEIDKGNYNIKIKPTTNDEFKDLIESFNSMAKTMSNRDSEKYKFITSASHQLKTPVVGVGMQIENLKEKMKKISASKYIKELDDIAENNNRAIVIINDLFKVLELGERYFATNLSSVKFIDLVDVVVKSFDKEVKKNKFKFEIDIPANLKITIDESRFKDVLLTLIENAVIYSNKNGLIKISIRKKDGKILFKITDEGIGIPKKDQLYVFDKFFRSQNSYTKKSVGTGLGLAIAKMIIEGHGGKIWFESEENKGATFYFSLPIVGSATDAFCYEVCSVPKSKGKK